MVDTILFLLILSLMGAPVPLLVAVVLSIVLLGVGLILVVSVVSWIIGKVFINSHTDED